ncbi:MAG: DedA family protein [Clostridiales bacterium]|nr:DedA family protein [Clostridiales bacterium]
MDIISSAIDIFLHLDVHLGSIISDYGVATYILLFIIIFCETGLVFTPFLPGDSLIFAAASFAALGSLKIFILIPVVYLAAILGDASNYSIGRFIGPKLIKKGKLIKQEHIDKTNKFYEKYGGKTIVIARFVPIVRTFAPFVAGIGEMTYRKFFSYNIIGATLWVSIVSLAGFFFSNIPIVKNNFSIVVMAIILLSLLPAVIELLKQKKDMAK